VHVITVILAMIAMFIVIQKLVYMEHVCEHCDHCLPQYIGPNCQQFCASAPCNATHMTGSCTDNKCDCEQGFDGPLCDTCATGFAGPNCTCDNTACGAPGTIDKLILLAHCFMFMI